ncbi:DUF4007 family protein, partial [Candidatus Poribacteria bacterium]|nr:DUF4007 family protein [Candidatus Poribacteria bacterium]
RYTWLKKGVDAVTADSSIFSSENATVSLGVGKNMVNSIRHWCSVAGLIKTDKLRGSGFVPSELGKRIFSDNGFDPYLDDPATLWLIHWKIATNMNQATSWYWAFNINKDIQFDRNSFKQEMYEWVTHNNGSIRKASDNTLDRDINCFIRTYCQSRNNVGVIEESFDCPLVELNLISELPENQGYEFQRGEKVTLPIEIFTATLIAFWVQRFNERDSLPFTDILNAPLSPGRIFKLDEDTMTLYLEKLDEMTEGAMHYDETADLKQVYRHRDVNPMHLIERYNG